MVRSFSQVLDLYRPLEKESYDSQQTYSMSVLDHVKLAQPSKGWTVSTNGSVQSVTATLYFNLDVSNAEPALEPLFKTGDVIVRHGAEVGGERFIVQSVTEQWLKGSLHHYEVVLA